MDDAKRLWSEWQSLLTNFQPLFTRAGWVRFVDWITGMVLCDEEHTITQILTTLGLESQWRVAEAFAEYGSWNREAVEQQLFRTLQAKAPGCWGGYCVLAIDDTKEHRRTLGVWGTSVLHQTSGRDRNRAKYVLAHNWVVMGRLVPGRHPWTYLPCASRLYIRRKSLPADETFFTKNNLAVAMLRQADRDAVAPVLAVVDGAFARANVLRPGLNPASGERRIDFITRPRHDARLYEPPVIKKSSHGGRPRKWGRRLANPKNHEQWNVPWKRGRAYIYGRMRNFRYKRVLCQWAVTGKDHLVYAYVFEVEGYHEPWYLICSATDLCASQVVAAGAARFRQEDGFRDQKQRLGMEECRAWTKEPILRTFQVQLVAQALLRLMEFHLDATHGKGTWWSAPDWNPRKRHPSLLDLRRLFWRHRERFSQFMVRLEKLAKPPQARFPRERTLVQAA
jgi:hypothetical protein